MAIVTLAVERKTEKNLKRPRRTLGSEPRAHARPPGNTVLCVAASPASQASHPLSQPARPGIADH